MVTFELSGGPRGTREVFEYLMRCANWMCTDNYKNICDQIAAQTKSRIRINHRTIGKHLGYIRTQCIDKQVPWINALAVGTNWGTPQEWRPSYGFLPESVSWEPSSEHLWRGMVLQVFSYDWSQIQVI